MQLHAVAHRDHDVAPDVVEANRSPARTSPAFHSAAPDIAASPAAAAPARPPKLRQQQPWVPLPNGIKGSTTTADASKMCVRFMEGAYMDCYK